MSDKHSKRESPNSNQVGEGEETSAPALDPNPVGALTTPSVRGQPPVGAQPRKRVSSWLVYRATPKDGKSSELFGLHLVGRDLSHGGGCVSGRIVSFDRKTMCCTTESGELYQLLSSPGINLAAERALNDWIELNDVDVEDATEEFMKTYGLTLDQIAERERLRWH